MTDFPVSETFVETANAVQLHDEARGANTEWPASFVQIDGGWAYRVDDRPDVTVDVEHVAAALANHVPVPPVAEPTLEERLAAIEVELGLDPFGLAEP